MENFEDYLKQEREQEWRVALRKNLKTKERTNLERISMPENDPDMRNKNHMEVNIGLSEEQALAEARRCIDCVNPTCITGCPVNINIPKFIKKIETGDFLGAAVVLKETNALPAVCGRVCPQEVQCEDKCFYHQKLNKKAVAIGNLERFVADYERNSGKISVPEVPPCNGIKVAVIGGGPAGLTVSGDLIKEGYDVTVFEALHEIGGVLK
jgi:glutamate synthase (NADPH) small chain